MDISKDLLDHFKLHAEILPDCTKHISYKSDRKRGLRKVKVVKTWTRGRDVGVGSFGLVWLEVDDEGSQRAVKKLSKRVCALYNIDIGKELAAMAVLSRYEEAFVHFNGWYEDPENVYVAMEYFPLGDLQRYMDTQMPESQVKLIVSQLLEGLKIMHENQFTHRDLKPQNIFVVEEKPFFWVKIGDFGISKRITHDQTFLRTEIGTPDYLAPEVLGYVEEETSRYTNAVDLWALGCVVHRLLTMRPPFVKPAALARYCFNRTCLHIETMKHNVISEEGIQFVKSLLMAQPSERLTTEAALSSPWLSQDDPSEVGESTDVLALLPNQVQDEGRESKSSTVRKTVILDDGDLPWESQLSTQYQPVTARSARTRPEEPAEKQRHDGDALDPSVRTTQCVDCSPTIPEEKDKSASKIGSSSPSGSGSTPSEERLHGADPIQTPVWSGSFDEQRIDHPAKDTPSVQDRGSPHVRFNKHQKPDTDSLEPRPNPIDVASGRPDAPTNPSSSWGEDNGEKTWNETTGRRLDWTIYSPGSITDEEDSALKVEEVHLAPHHNGNGPMPSFSAQVPMYPLGQGQQDGPPKPHSMSPSFFNEEPDNSKPGDQRMGRSNQTASDLNSSPEKDNSGTHTIWSMIDPHTRPSKRAISSTLTRRGETNPYTEDTRGWGTGPHTEDSKSGKIDPYLTCYQRFRDFSLRHNS